MDIITTALANARGLLKNQLTRLAESGRLFHLVHGGYGPDPDPTALAVRAQVVAAVTGPTGTVCRRTAAWLWGLDVLPPGRKSHDWPVEILVAAGERMPVRRPGCLGRQ